jgi:hypothetical protein
MKEHLYCVHCDSIIEAEKTYTPEEKVDGKQSTAQFASQTNKYAC